MGDAAYLVRSYSQPSECPRDSDDVNPHRCLGQSISFGRFDSETLSWEKWSTFSRNRYLEEAEQYSKPGSVAKMKAHFEAHFKRLADAKKAAAEEELHARQQVYNTEEEEVKCTTTHQSCGFDTVAPEQADDLSFHGSQLSSSGLATSASGYTGLTLDGQDYTAEALDPQETTTTSFGSCGEAEVGQTDFAAEMDIDEAMDVQDHVLAVARCDEVFSDDSGWLELQQSNQMEHDESGEVKFVPEKELREVQHKDEGQEMRDIRVEEPSTSDISKTSYRNMSKLEGNKTSHTRVEEPSTSDINRTCGITRMEESSSPDINETQCSNVSKLEGNKTSHTRVEKPSTSDINRTYGTLSKFKGDKKPVTRMEESSSPDINETPCSNTSKLRGNKTSHTRVEEPSISDINRACRTLSKFEGDKKPVTRMEESSSSDINETPCSNMSKLEKGKRAESRIGRNLSTSNMKKTPYSKTSKLSTSFSKIMTPVRCSRKEEGLNPGNNKKATRDYDTVGSRRLASKSVQVFTSTAPRDDVIERSGTALTKKTGIRHCVTPSVKNSKLEAIPLRTPPVRASSAHGVSMPKFVTPLPEVGRKRVTLSSSFAGSKSVGSKLQTSSVLKSKTSDSCGFKAQARITMCPFTFRSEERAAKRQEFFQRQREKEAGNTQYLEGTKQTQENNFLRMNNSVVHKVKSAAIKSSKSLGGAIKKMGATQPYSPKFGIGRKQCPSMQESCKRSLQRSFIKTNNSNLKQEMKYNRLAQSTIQPSKSSRQENMSPNIV